MWQLKTTPSPQRYGCNAFHQRHHLHRIHQRNYNPCGQTESWYENDSNDTSATDELLYEIEANAGTAVIADSGEVDFGPNPTVVSLRQRMSSFPATRTSATLRERLLARATTQLQRRLPVTPWGPQQAGAVYVVRLAKLASTRSRIATLTATTEIGAPKYAKQALH